jgi:hypothetical protein
MSTPGPLETLARIVGDALSPLAMRLQGDQVEGTIEQLGLRLPTGALTSGALPQALQASAAACAQLPASVAALNTAIEGDDDDALIAAAAQLAQQIIQAGAAFTQLGTAIDNVVQAEGGLTAAQKARLSTDAQAIPERLLHLALISWLQDGLPAVKGALGLVGLIDDSAVPGDPADPSQPPFHLKRVRFDRIGPLFSDPAQHLKDLYGFGRPDFDGLELFRRIKQLVDRPDAEAIIITAPGQPAALEAFIFRLAVEPGAVPGLRARLRVTAEKDLNVSAALGGPWSATVDSTARFEGSIEFLLNPQTGLRIEPPAATASVAIAFGLKAAKSDGTPMILIGQAGASRLELLSAAARLPLQLSASTGAPSPEVKFGIALELKQGKLVIDASHADGFIGTILGGVRMIESDFDLSALYDTDKGLRFTGSATIEIALPTHITLGPISIPNLYLIGGFKDGTIPIEFSVDLVAQLGPLSATVNRIGALATISFPKRGGNAGAAQIDVGFKPPNGVGLSVDAGVVKGGGFLFIDVDRGEYAGALELTFSDFLSLKAVGIINTRMPDGSSGFSLLIIITAEFGSGLQLGFGFTLLGVGGLLGLNRTMRLDALVEGVRTGGLNSILFPRDVVANATQIISDLRAFFPPQTGIFLIGPMAKLGWGTPTLVSLTIGIVIEIPGNIALIGVLRVALPTDDAAVVVLQVSFIGAIEFDKSRGWFFATLFDSRVLFITIQGEMGLLIAFGNDANFVVSVGGFHPRYSPPALPFPTPRRIALDILNTSVARIRAEGYFAVTSNSVQFGCMAEAFLGFSALNVSGHFQLDALIRFSPFFFIISFSSEFEVKVFGVGVWGLRIRLEVQGPTPWRAHGSAGISLLFFDIDVDIDITWGDDDQTNLPPLQVLPKLVEELSKPDSWRPLPPPGSSLLVSVRKLPEAESKIAFHPLGTLQVSQRFAPLDAKLDRVGAQRPGDGKQFSLAAASAVFAKRGDVQERFAPAQFEDLSDDERLSRKAFEDRHGGVELSSAGAQLESGASITRVARYDLITIDTNARRHRRTFHILGSLLFTHFLAGASVALSSLSARTRNAKAPVQDGVKTRSEGFAVALQENNKAVSAETVFASEGAASDWMSDAVANDRSLADKLHVVPEFELVA